MLPTINTILQVIILQIHAKYNIYYRKNLVIPGQIRNLFIVNSMKDN